MTVQAARRLVFGTLAALALVGALGSFWLARVRLVRVEVKGVPHDLAPEVARLTGARHGDRLFGLTPTLVEDRVRRHPYVAAATATRLPWGVLRVTTSARVPVALALDGDGDPAALLDAAGYAMPLPAHVPDDLPLVHGATLPVNRSAPVKSPALRRLLADLPARSDAVDALVSDFELTDDGQIVLVTAPTPDGQSLRVQLGREGFADRLDRLARFWAQAVLSRPGQRYALLDLRFHGLVVTREAGPGQAFADTARTARPDSTALKAAA